MKLLIESVKNGYILSYKNEDGATNKLISLTDKKLRIENYLHCRLQLPQCGFLIPV